ncbi:hypothetical protein EXN00_14465 [Clostridium botulinum]|uniref:Uncharacterized protein n=1 Tax=Clostridium botulinum TaxID=1491 RepID=A0A6B4CZZ1_CLOBO|nr:hypothetical protein [Clostridium botulinum]NFA06154.1 hypothetical protein [Clostridium botulinum]NFA25092.1 hypothetical protein [Clostridium botulinum]NFA33701.1 hypothetical protein [Clostridium botulinum]NFA81914.1 hypothetical protein [Clostridium botulinum]
MISNTPQMPPSCLYVSRLPANNPIAIIAIKRTTINKNFLILYFYCIIYIGIC